MRFGVMVASALLLLSCASSKMPEEMAAGKALFLAGDYTPAFRQLLPAAVKGRADAQYAVGYMYYYGYGVAQDSESGIFWMEKSAEQNYQPAIDALDRIHHTSPELLDNSRVDQSQPYTPEFRKGSVVTGSYLVDHPEKKQYRLPYLSMREQQDPVMDSLPQKNEKSTSQVAMRTEKNTDMDVLQEDDGIQIVEKPVLPPIAKADIKPETAITAAPTKIAEVKPIVKPETKTVPKIVAKVSPKPMIKIAEAAKITKSTKPETTKKVVAAKLNPNDFTLQLFGSFQLDAVKNLQSKLNIQTSSHILHYARDGKTWYVLAYGKFSNVHEAIDAKHRLHTQLSQMQPWVRTFAGLQLA